MSVLEDFKPVFYPESVAVVGASMKSRKPGYYCVKSLVDGGFEGKVWPVNPHLSTVLGLRAYPSVKAIPEKVDLAIIAVPAPLVPLVLVECAEKGVKGTIIITAGFKETEDKLGVKLQKEVTAIANKAGIKIIGPNTFGMINTCANLNASFTPMLGKLITGRIALISQSGGIAHILSYYAIEENIGLSKLIGLGNRCNVEFTDLLEYLANDPDTDAIMMHIEGVDDARRLMGVARRVTENKAIIAYKTGKTQAVNRAVYSHTGSLAGRYELYEAAFRQAGVIMVNNLLEMLDAAKAITTSPLPTGDRIAIVSKEAGPTIIAIDACESFGLTLANFSVETIEGLKELLPPFSSHVRMNPVDMPFASKEAWETVMKAILRDENVDVLLVLSLYHPTFPLLTEEMVSLLSNFKKPIIACITTVRGRWTDEISKLERNGIPVYPTPERASRALANLVKYSKIQKQIY